MEVMPGYKQTEVGAIPVDWETKRLGELGAVVRGGSPRPAGDPRYFNGSYIPWLTVGSLTNIPDNQIFVTETATKLTREGSQHSRTLESGALVMVNSGAKTLGVTKILSIKCCANDGIAALLDQRDGDKQFLCYYLNSQIKRLREVVAAGNDQLNLNTDRIALLSIPFPEAPEQRAIAKALSDIDTLLSALERLISKKRDLKQAVTQELLTGQTRLPGFSDEWSVRKIGEVTVTDPEALPSSTLPNFQFNYISLEDVDYGVLKNYSQIEFKTAPSRARRRLRNDDVLVATVRPNLKSHLLFHGDGQSWVCSTGFCVVRCRDQVTHPGYVFFHMFGDHVARQIENLLSGSNYPAINSKEVRALEIPLPSYAEQAAIVEVLSDMDAELRALECRREKTRALKQGMMQALLTGKTRLV